MKLTYKGPSSPQYASRRSGDRLHVMPRLQIAPNCFCFCLRLKYLSKVRAKFGGICNAVVRVGDLPIAEVIAIRSTSFVHPYLISELWHCCKCILLVVLPHPSVQGCYEYSLVFGRRTFLRRCVLHGSQFTSICTKSIRRSPTRKTTITNRAQLYKYRLLQLVNL